jgi:hypothetical protein
VQGEIFIDFEGDKSLHDSPFFKKQRGRWTKKQARMIEILADPLNSILTDQQVAEACNLTRQYVNKLQRDERFMQEVDRRRKSDRTIMRLRARVWKALFHNLEKSPSKIRTALEALGDLKPMAVQNVLQVYENFSDQEVDRRLEAVLRDRQRACISVDENDRRD